MPATIVKRKKAKKPQVIMAHDCDCVGQVRDSLYSEMECPCGMSGDHYHCHDCSGLTRTKD